MEIMINMTLASLELQHHPVSCFFFSLFKMCFIKEFILFMDPGVQVNNDSVRKNGIFKLWIFDVNTVFSEKTVRRSPSVR